MFTGIIEETGKVISFTKDLNGAALVIGCKQISKDSKIGDSISINGVCQTIADISSDSFTSKVSEETLSVTTFGTFVKGDTVNLERALTLNTRLGGHIVTGHADCTGKFVRKEQLSDFYNLEFEIPREQEKYVVHKGSIAINGISLTVAQINGNIVKTAIIPLTYNETNLKYLKIGDYVNIETDILSKYVEKILSAKDNNNRISVKFLQENGFI